MFRLVRPSLFLMCACVLGGIGGCGNPTAAPMLNAQPISNAIAENSADEDSGHGAGYAFHIRYPQLQPEWNTLGPALHAYAAAQVKDFLEARNADENTDQPPYNLDLEFNISRRTEAFVSVLASGSSYTGGAHPAPIAASFNLCTSSDKLVTLADLFTDFAAALQELSAETRRQLEGRYEAKLRETTPEKDLDTALKNMREWVARGTAPSEANFAVFLVDGLEAKAIGLTVVFPPYQVASYAEGPQQVEVPAKVFYALLKPEYRDAFQIDTEAEKLAPGVR